MCIRPKWSWVPAYYAKRKYAIIDLKGAVDEVHEGIHGALPSSNMDLMVWICGLQVFFLRLTTVFHLNIRHRRCTCGHLRTPHVDLPQFRLFAGLVHVILQDCLKLNGQALSHAVDEVDNRLIPFGL